MSLTKQTKSKSNKRNTQEFIESIEFLTAEIQELYSQDEIPWIIGVSWGKDSSSVLQLIWSAIAKLPESKRTKTIHVISTDTLVENPIVSGWVRKSLEQLQTAATEQKMPFEAHLLHPEIKNTFWVCLMGKGYPAPRNQFRWCTERMKINPANNFIRHMVRNHGETILALGTRKAESAKRAATMKKHEKGRVRDRLSPNGRLMNSLIYTPIEDWATEEVWMYLMLSRVISCDGIHSTHSMKSPIEKLLVSNCSTIMIDSSILSMHSLSRSSYSANSKIADILSASASESSS